MLRQTTSNANTQDSPWPKFGGSHHLPPYTIFCSSPRGSHLNDFLSHDSQVGVLKFSQLGFLWLWGRITLRVNLWLQWSLKRSCSPCQELFNGMSHVAYTRGNWVDFDLFFGHNLCFRCPNGRCKPILDIYVSITFQWYKELFEVMSFDPCNCAVKIRESIWVFNSYNESSLESVKVHSLTFFALPGACDVTLGLSFDLQHCNPLSQLRAQG